MATEQDWASYRGAVVDVTPPGRDPFRITPAAPGVHGRWPFSSTAAVHVLTAWNPDSVRLDRDVNEARNGRLVAELEARGLTWWPASGRDLAGDHAEDGVAVFGLSEPEALAAGRDHGQAAIYRWTPEAWQVVACTGERRHASGWRTGPVPAPPG
jgi:hypothetical protein